MPKSVIEPKVGLYANQYVGTDAYPYEIIEVNSRCKITIRAMSYKIHPDFKPDITPGGFAGHCNNVWDQKWIITSNPEGAILEIRRSKDGWGRGYFKIEEEPYYFHDYNF